MENLSLHIEYLLLRHDCVIVPGIGAFINIYEPPVFDRSTGRISPMKREVRFNSALRADDGMLASSYARKSGISYREGSEMLMRDIAVMNEALDIDGEITIGRLGVVRRNQEGNLIYNPLVNEDRMNRELGFLPVSYLSKENEGGREIKSEVKVSPEVKIEKQTTLEEAEVISRVRKMDFKRNYYVPLNKFAVKLCACLIVILALCLTAINPLSDTRRVEERASVLPIDKLIDSAGGNLKEKIAVAQPESVAPEPDIEPEVIEEPDYYLIVATFVSEKEAERFVEMNGDRGYELEVVPSKRLYRVSAKSSADKAELFSELNTDSFKSGFSEGWVWEKK